MQEVKQYFMQFYTSKFMKIKLQGTKTRKRKKLCLMMLTILVLSMLLAACSSQKTSKDKNYEAQTITVEGLPDGSSKPLAISSLRELEQINLDASYQRTTGTTEKYKMQGPKISDVVSLAGADINNYEGIGVVGSDGYYCLIPKDIILSTPDLMLALIVDKKAKLDEAIAPAMLGIQGQYGPYWVKKIEKIILYENIPKKDIKSVWIFENLTDGIEPYYYEYYGSKDKAIEIIQIFSRFDSFDSKAFFTMKSSDGFKKNEVMNMIKPQYYIKVEGEDAPTNIAPYIKLGMNVKNISWFSTNEDAVIFTHQLEKYLEKTEINKNTGIVLSEVLYELEFESIKELEFELIDTSSSKISISGQNLDKCILYENDGKYSVSFDDSLNISNIENLMRIKIKDTGSEISKLDKVETKEESKERNEEETKEKSEDESKENESSQLEDSTKSVKNDETSSSEEKINKEENEENIDNSKSKESAYDLEIKFDKETKGYTLEELKSLKSMHKEFIYSTTNNYPVKKSYAAKGVDLLLLIEELKLDRQIETITFTAKDGYACKITYDQLFNSYSYPDAISLNTSNKVIAPVILAFESAKDTANIQDAEKCNLKLFVGQKGINEPNTLAMVDNLASIDISFDKAEKWGSVSCDAENLSADSIKDGIIFAEKGTKINLTHEYIDNVKIYYTTDGSTPNYNSSIYNPSTSYFQPELTVPITVNADMTIKVIACGFGRAESDVVVFEIKIKE